MPVANDCKYFMAFTSIGIAGSLLLANKVVDASKVEGRVGLRNLLFLCSPAQFSTIQFCNCKLKRAEMVILELYCMWKVWCGRLCSWIGFC